MANEIAPIALRDSAWAAQGRRFYVPWLMRLASLRRGTVAMLTVSGVAGAHECRFEGGAGGASLTLTPGALEPVEIPPGTRSLLLIGDRAALAGVQVAYFPVRGQFPLGRVILKVHSFLAGYRSTASAGATLKARWRQASEAARHLGFQMAARLASSPLQLRIARPVFLKFRSRFVEDFAAVAPPEAAPVLVFVTPVGAETPRAEELSACAAALRQQTDPAFQWLLAVAEERLAREEAALSALVAGIGRLVPAAREGAAGALGAALAQPEPADALLSVLDARGAPTRDAVAMIRAAFADVPGLMLLYTDEEHRDAAGEPIQGVFKPAYNRHFLESSPYLGALTVVRADRARQIGLRARFAAAAPYDFLLRYVEGLDAAALRHLPRIAYGGPMEPAGFPDPETGRLAAEALAETLSVPVQTVADGRFLRPLFPVPPAPPLVSIVVPTRDRAELLGMTLRTLIAQTAYRRFEIVVVDNGSVEPATFALFDEVKRLWPATQIVRDDGDFNFSRICNNGIAVTSGELILLLNNDVEVIDGSWLDEMVALISRRDHGVDTGIVGAKLLFPDRTLQHGGVIVGLFGYASHWFSSCQPEAEGPQGRLLVRQDMTAVTGACLLIRRDVWERIGPLDPVRFPEDCNDIDLCMRARQAGYGVVWTPHALLIHHESASRGTHRTAAHRARLKQQHRHFEELWKASVFVDPHYNPNLSRVNSFAIAGKAPLGPRTARTAQP
ncbi:glycosyltransferase family 2 protein [Xanthobacter sp. KR7-225]|uniref:glycosyltransferase family 2 protein n=1 Tax=Xanthobacter sp. KR7-225 TaxID=3156613 RepID=UPI0032B5984A